MTKVFSDIIKFIIWLGSNKIEIFGVSVTLMSIVLFIAVLSVVAWFFRNMF